MNLELLLLIPTAIINVLLGLLVIMRGPHRMSSRFFATSAFFISFWAVGDLILLTAQNPSLVRFGAILFYVAPMFTTLYLVFFSRVFPSTSRLPFFERAIWFTATLALASLIIFNENFLTQSIQIYDDGLNLLIANPVGYSIYALFFSTCFITSYVNLYRSLKKNYGYRRNQVRYSFLGIFLSSMLAFITNLMLPIIVSAEFIWLGPLFTMAYVVATTIAIVKHRLFDIRLVVARSVTYVLLLTSLAALYAIAAFTFSSLFLGDSTQLGLREVVYALLAVFLSLTFQPLKRLFDRLTNRIFYRDAYDSQKVLDELGAVLVNTISPKTLTDQALHLLRHAIRPSFIYIVLNDSGAYMKEKQFIVGEKPKDLEPVVTAYKHSPHSLVVQDEILDQTTHLYKTMQATNVAIITRLQTSKETVGYVLFGYKASGAVYDNKDINLIKIATDELAVAIQNTLRFEEISHFNVTLREEVAQATAELRQSNAKLQQLDKAKDEFISMASHQLRTPLTSVKGYLSMVLEGDVGSLKPDQRKLVEEAYSSSQRMVYLIGDFLNVSRIQTGKFVLERKKVTLPNVIKEEIEQLATTAERRSVRLEYHTPTHFPTLDVDENKIRQVIMNLIDNAIFYSKPGGVVKVELIASAKEACFKVRDSGIGVPEEERHKLFTKFFRASNARRARPDGTGIGLFMAKKVIVAHGGSIIFETQENKGSTFGFCLPVIVELENKPKELEQQVAHSQHDTR
ncbi:MAG: ATP-binding protein [Candidatus Saccharimonadales bacterium]